MTGESRANALRLRRGQQRADREDHRALPRRQAGQRRHPAALCGAEADGAADRQRLGAARGDGRDRRAPRHAAHARVRSRDLLLHVQHEADRPPVFNVENACATGSAAVQLADAYLRSGGGRIALVVGYEKMVHADKRVPLRALEACSDLGELDGLKEAAGPEGANRSVFMDIYAGKIHRHMAQSGARPDHLAMIAAKNHGNGALNPKAQFRTPRSAEEVLAARTVVPPLTLFMCSPISDGAAAIVLMAADEARDRHIQGPVLAGCALAMDNLGDGRSQMVEVARTAYARASHRRDRCRPNGGTGVADARPGGAPTSGPRTDRGCALRRRPGRLRAAQRRRGHGCQRVEGDVTGAGDMARRGDRAGPGEGALTG
ncbi:thiolase family protein [Leptolyngbya sp. 15MV]|nr:thiolase family protein [Leptolyngbya sp. 15MV]